MPNSSSYTHPKCPFKIFSLPSKVSCSSRLLAIEKRYKLLSSLTKAIFSESGENLTFLYLSGLEVTEVKELDSIS